MSGASRDRLTRVRQGAAIATARGDKRPEIVPGARFQRPTCRAHPVLSHGMGAGAGTSSTAGAGTRRRQDAYFGQDEAAAVLRCG